MKGFGYWYLIVKRDFCHKIHIETPKYIYTYIHGTGYAYEYVVDIGLGIYLIYIYKSYVGLDMYTCIWV